MAASRQGPFAISRAAYDRAIAAGATPEDAQKAADEAVQQNAIATGKPIPQRAISTPDDEPPERAPSLRTVQSEMAMNLIPQLPNAVNPALQQRVTPPHLPSRSEEEWAVRDTQFMHAMCYGVSFAQGERAYMEDEHCIVQHFDKLVRLMNPQPAPAAAAAPASGHSVLHSPTSPSGSHPHRGLQSFFGVYDGHGGREAATFVRDHLHVNIARRMAGADASPTANSTSAQKAVDFGEAMKQGAADTEAALLAHSVDSASAAGAVVAFTIFCGMQVYVAHAGDTRAVLCREGIAMDLTQDHKPGLESEQDRVAAMGGFISEGCVNGEIAVSRALGDVNLETGRKMLGLSAEVALSKFYLCDEDEFVIIACDGVWDVMNSAAAVSYVRHQLAQHNDIQRAADELVQQALRQQSTDNVSCILVGFSRTQSDGEPTIVPKAAQTRSLQAHSRAHRVPIPPRPQRLQLNRGGLSKLRAALDIDAERFAPISSDEEEKND